MAPNPIPVVNNDLTGKTNYFWDNIEDQFSQQGTLPRSKAWQFNVKGGGAIGDNVTDDTAAIQATINAAFAYAQANTGYAEVVFDPNSVYFVNGNPSTASSGNSVLRIPLNAVTNAKVTLVFNGGWDATALYHWQQTTVQKNGAVIRPGFAQGSAPTSGGSGANEPSVLGGPLPYAGYGAGASLFNNVNVVVYGLGILLPNDPHICGFDFRGMAQAQLTSCSVLTSTTGNPGSQTAATQAWQFGVAMPQANNNDLCRIDNLSIEGMNYGLIASEHTNGNNIRLIYCIAGLVVSGGDGSSTPHWMWFGYVSVEACQIGLQGAYDTANPTKLHIDLLDWESAGGNWSTFHVINDPNSNLLGDVTVNNITPSTPVTATFGQGPGATGANATTFLNGGTGLRILNTGDIARGAATAPTFPLTTVALLNGSGHDAAVTVTAGAAATTIAVDGVTQGVVPVSGVVTFVVPSNKTITPTFASGTPSWKWTLL